MQLYARLNNHRECLGCMSAYTASDKHPVLETTAITILWIGNPCQMEGPTVAGGNNCGSRTWSGGTIAIGDAVFGRPNHLRRGQLTV